MRRYGYTVVILALSLVLNGCANIKVTETDSGSNAESEISGVSSASGSSDGSSGSLASLSQTSDSSLSEGHSEAISIPTISVGNSALVSSSPASANNSSASSGLSSSASSQEETKTLLENIAEKIKEIFSKK